MLEIVEVVGKTERWGTVHRMQWLSAIVAKKSSRKLLKSESSGSTVTIVPCTRNLSSICRSNVMKEGKKVYFQAFGTLWDAKGYYRIREDHLILQVVKAVPAIDIARGHIRGKRVAKGLPPMQIPLPAGADPLEVLENTL